MEESNSTTKNKGRPSWLKGREPIPAQACCTPGCPNEWAGGLGGGRGLCKKCHHDATRLVKKGETTWEELERLGLAKGKYSTLMEKALYEARRKARKE